MVFEQPHTKTVHPYIPIAHLLKIEYLPKGTHADKGRTVQPDGALVATRRIAATGSSCKHLQITTLHTRTLSFNNFEKNKFQNIDTRTRNPLAMSSCVDCWKRPAALDVEPKTW